MLSRVRVSSCDDGGHPVNVMIERKKVKSGYADDVHAGEVGIVNVSDDSNSEFCIHIRRGRCMVV